MNPVRPVRAAAIAHGYRALVSGQKRGVLALLARFGLSICAAPYGIGVRLRNRFFDWGWKRVARAGVPVVSIGNLTLGGTGKTPAVEYVARFYRDLDLRVAILSRGYGSGSGGRNDEALVLEDNLPDAPHLQGADRVELARTAVEELESEVLVLDDGFQHRRLHRDLDIVLIDATEPWGHGRLFPRGLLREPKSSLRRAHVVLLSRCNQVPGDDLMTLRQQVQRLAPQAPIVESTHAPRRLVNAQGAESPLDELRGRPVAAFCGIGNPEAFADTLRRLGADLVHWRTFPDHHAYQRDDVAWLRNWATPLPHDSCIVTTQKDLVKLRLTELAGRPLWALQIALQPTAGREALEAMLKEGIRGQRSDSGSQHEG
jgi:tetraacyldisaccharide 4'-kinase